MPLVSLEDLLDRNQKTIVMALFILKMSIRNAVGADIILKEGTVNCASPALDALDSKIKVISSCVLMSKREHEAVAAEKFSHQASYDAAVSGLNYFEQCDSEEAFVTQGYLLSVKAMAEHYLSSGDSRTDFNQANALLVKCQTTPGIYGTHRGAQCETQEHNNISTQMNWDMEAQ